jgi:hypothetical protein
MPAPIARSGGCDGIMNAPSFMARILPGHR